MGRVTDLAVDEGDRVTKGQFLLQIDPRNLRASVDAAAQASLAAAARSREQMRVAREREGPSSWRRTSTTVSSSSGNRGLTTREALDTAENELKMRQSDATRRKSRSEDAASAHDAGAGVARERQVLDLSKVRIESPIDGIVTRRNIEEGETVVVGTMNNAGTVLLTIADMSVIEAQVEVDETDIPTVTIGQMAKVTIDAMPGKSFPGKVVEIGNSPIQAAGRTTPRRRRPTFS